MTRGAARRWRRALTTLGLFACGPALFAQTTDASEEESRANYAFASQLGAGIYDFAGGRVQVYRVGGGIGLRSAETDRWGITLHIPVTIGFYGFDAAKVLETGLPGTLGTLALVPELRFDLPLTDDWRIMPFVGAGAGRDFSADRFNYILTIGARSRWVRGLGTFDLHVGNRLFYSGYTTPDVEFGDDFAGLDSGVDVRHPLGFSLRDHGVDLGAFVMSYLYLASPELVRFGGKPLSVDAQWEAGVTIGTTPPIRFLGLALPRLGVSRRVGGGVSALRLVMGGPLP